MTSVIREKQKRNFEHKKITPKIIRDIAKIISDEATSKKGKDEKVKVIFSIDADDKNVSFESESPLIFDEKEGKLEDIFINKIYMALDSFEDSKKIEVQITHQIGTKGNTNNYIWVSGNDSRWVNGTMSILWSIIDSAEEQRKVSNLVSTSIFSIVVLSNILFFDLCITRIQAIPYVIIRLIIVFAIPILSILAGIRLNDLSASLWPSVELKTGQGYQQDASKKRKLAWLYLTLIIIPTGLEIIFEFIKHIIKNA